MREAGEIGVGGIALLAADHGFDAETGKVGRHLGAAGEFRQEGRVTPGGVDLHFRGQHVGVAFEAHLVVAASRGAMGEDGAAGGFHAGNQAANGDGAGDAG